MRTLIFTLLFLVMGGSYAQTTQPYQPDANGDGLINAEDMLSFLTVFNTQWGPDLGSLRLPKAQALETLMADLLNGDAAMDSLYFAYSIYDSAEIFMPECPDP